jgi:hypothetical protein
MAQLKIQKRLADTLTTNATVVPAAEQLLENITRHGFNITNSTG